MTVRVTDESAKRERMRAIDKQREREQASE
jgi:hypothetical protein